MQSQCLERLVDTARALPGRRSPAPPVRLPQPPAPLSAQMDAAADDAVPEVRIDAAELRGRLGRFLFELARRLDPALKDALQHAAVAWDAFDAVLIMDEALHRDAGLIADAAAVLERQTDLSLCAIGMEVRITLVSTLGLIELIERRLATLVRLRVQSKDPTLLPDERPFLDIAAALAEAARGWV